MFAQLRRSRALGSTYKTGTEAPRNGGFCENRTRPFPGIQCIDKLDGVAADRERLKAIFDTISGALRRCSVSRQKTHR